MDIWSLRPNWHDHMGKDLYHLMWSYTGWGLLWCDRCAKPTFFNYILQPEKITQNLYVPCLGAALTGLLISSCFQLGPHVPGQPLVNTTIFHTAVIVQLNAWLFIHQEHYTVFTTRYEIHSDYFTILLPLLSHIAANDCIIKCMHNWVLCALSWKQDGFGGLVVSMLASGSRVRGFKPGWSCWIFQM
jgi:hypothetical protein